MDNKKRYKSTCCSRKDTFRYSKRLYRAEIVSFDDLVKCGSVNLAKEKGLMRSEGKEYIMKDGDVVLFRFNV
jgi:ribosome-binding ATPase YchF (GTP1/OBG family)